MRYTNGYVTNDGVFRTVVEAVLPNINAFRNEDTGEVYWFNIEDKRRYENGIPKSR